MEILSITEKDQSRHETFMKMALHEAKLASLIGEVPVGAVIVNEMGHLIARSSNRKEANFNPLGHAELIAIQNASENLQAWRLLNCTLYVTLEPCVMCAGAIIQSRIARVVYAANDPKAGAVKSLYKILEDERLNHRPEVISGVLAQESQMLLREFFALRRRQRVEIPN